MFPFNRRIKLIDSDLFEGLTDHHSHILPGVDDGIEELSSSLEALSYFESLGVRKLYLTPHRMCDLSSTTEILEGRFADLQRDYRGAIELSLASEYMLDGDYLSHLEGGVLGMDGDGVLVETSYLSSPYNFDELLYETLSSGLRPIIAHPERYAYMTVEDYKELKQRGCSLQFNLLSLSGCYGSSVVRKAEYLLENKMYDYIGSDLHSLELFRKWIERVKVTRSQLKYLNSLK